MSENLTPEQRAAQITIGGFDFCRPGDPLCEDHKRIAAAIRDAVEAERRQHLKIIHDYMKGCEATAQKLADSTDETDNNMYWRADGASDALEAVAQLIDPTVNW